MSEKKIPNLQDEHIKQKDMEKVYFSEDVTACFACGEKIDTNNKKCPYCGVDLKKE